MVNKRQGSDIDWVDLRDAHCGFGLLQSAQILFCKSSRLESSLRIFFAATWSAIVNSINESYSGQFPMPVLAVTRAHEHKAVHRANHSRSVGSLAKATAALRDLRWFLNDR